MPFQNNQDFEALKTCIVQKKIARQVQSPVAVSSEGPGRGDGDSLQKEKHTALN